MVCGRTHRESKVGYTSIAAPIEATYNGGIRSPSNGDHAPRPLAPARHQRSPSYKSRSFTSKVSEIARLNDHLL